MQTWTEKGRANTKLMLAKMSIPPDQSNAYFSEFYTMIGLSSMNCMVWSKPLIVWSKHLTCHTTVLLPLAVNMKSQHRESLSRRLQDHGPNFGLNMRSLMVEGFEIRFKSCIRLSASDMVAMMTVTLGMPREDAVEAKMGFQ